MLNTLSHLQFQLLRELETADDSTFLSVQACELKDPTTLLLVSIFLGSLGIDRFMLVILNGCLKAINRWLL